jgi:hypothetical protein
MAAPKGHPRYGGRQKGTSNKLTADVRAAIAHAFDRVGGVDWLVTLAKKDPKAFSVLLAKVMPAEVEAEVSPLDRMTLEEQKIFLEALEIFVAEREDA